ncbi:MAG: hypothetical protein V5B32_16320 [Candidatus Accumulibacter sp. UW26]|jgi:hypothetical protein|nr:hypothetical protein [Candidatus Accumulibacter necessarius]
MLRLAKALGVGRVDLTSPEYLEDGNTQAAFDGGLDGFIVAGLKQGVWAIGKRRGTIRRRGFQC